MIQPLMSRRAALRASGVSIALPFLESLLPTTRAGDGGSRPLRVAFVYAPNGKHMQDWTPKTEGRIGKLPPTLEALESVRDHVTVLAGLSLRMASPGVDGPGDHARAMATFLTGVRPHKTSGADVRAGVSVDQVLAASLGKGTRLPSLEIGCEGGKPAGICDNGYSCAYQTNLSWRTATVPMPKEVNPRLVFERLFGGRDKNESDAARAKRDRDRRSILDFVAEDTRYMRDRLGGADRRKLDEYLDGVREIETRVQRTQATASVGRDRIACPTGVPENYGEHARLLADLTAVAFEADLTRVVTFVLGNDGSNRSYREVGVSDGHHDVSHHGNDPAKQQKIRKINMMHVEQFAYLLKRLQSTPEGDGTLLDQCLVVYGSGIRDGDRHDHDDLPILLAGGQGTPRAANKGGRCLRYPDGTPLCNLYLSLLDRAGVAVERFGDSDGKLKGLFV